MVLLSKGLVVGSEYVCFCLEFSMILYVLLLDIGDELVLQLKVAIVFD